MSERKQNRASAISFMSFVTTTKTLYFCRFAGCASPSFLCYRIASLFVWCVSFSWFSTFFSSLLFVKIKALLFYTVQKVQKCTENAGCFFLFVLAYRCYGIEKIEDLALLYFWWSFFFHILGTDGNNNSFLWIFGIVCSFDFYFSIKNSKATKLLNSLNPNLNSSIFAAFA